MTATINGLNYRIEFSYRRREGRHAELPRHSPVAGLTACAIVCDSEPKIVAVAAVMCSAGDAWSRRTGRWQAFSHAVSSCGILRPQAKEFFAWFGGRFPVPVRPAQPPHPPALTPDEMALRRSEDARERGRTARLARKAAKAAVEEAGAHVVAVLHKLKAGGEA